MEVVLAKDAVLPTLKETANGPRLLVPSCNCSVAVSVLPQPLLAVKENVRVTGAPFGSNVPKFCGAPGAVTPPVGSPMTKPQEVVLTGTSGKTEGTHAIAFQVLNNSGQDVEIAFWIADAKGTESPRVKKTLSVQ